MRSWLTPGWPAVLPTSDSPGAGRCQAEDAGADQTVVDQDVGRRPGVSLP